MILKSLFKTRNEVEEGYLNFHVFSHLGELNIKKIERLEFPCLDQSVGNLQRKYTSKPALLS